jgi:MFS transporter, PHS family, inorganic phosphate transporter
VSYLFVVAATELFIRTSTWLSPVLVEELTVNHHHSSDGMSLTKQQNHLRQTLLESSNSNESIDSWMIRRQRHQRLRPAGRSDDGSPTNGLQTDVDENDENGDRLFRVTQQHFQLNASPNDDLAIALPWYRQRHQVSAMISNFSTSYNVVNVSLVLPILKVALHQSRSQEESWSTDELNGVKDAESAVASSLLAGMMVGQILGGILGDVVGAARALRCVMILQVVASIGSSCSNIVGPASFSPSIYWYLAAWRFLLGIGAGGVYPLAAVLSAETNAQENRGSPITENTAVHLGEESGKANGAENGMSAETNVSIHDEMNRKLHLVVLTFSTQGLGFLMVPLVTIPLLFLLPGNLNLTWRLILGLGSLPGLFLLLWQWNASAAYEAAPTLSSRQLDESALEQSRDTDRADSGQNNEEQAENSTGSDDGENESVLDSVAEADVFHDALEDGHAASPPFPSDVIIFDERKSLWDSFRSEENLIPKLLGTAATWFLFDVLFYGNTLFQPIVVGAAFGARDHSNQIHYLQRTALDSLILTLIALPGYIVASILLGKKTRWCYCGMEQTPRFVMLQGFAAMSILYLTIGSSWDQLRRFPSLLMLLYSLTFFFANYGPNTTTFVLPSIVFAPECRSTFNGLSAAAGKLGAFTGASLFKPAADRLGNAAVMLLCAFISVVALVITKYFVPSSASYDDPVESGDSHRSRAHVRVPAEAEIS